MGVVWPLTGRTEELDELRRWLLGDDGTGVVLAGEAGVGKTRLAREVLAAAADAGFATEWVVATEAAATVPLAAFAELLPPGNLGASERIDLFRGVAAVVRGRATDRGIVVAVDDAHLLDDAAAALLLHLASFGVARLVVTVRSGEAMSDAIVALWKDRLLERLDLHALGRADTTRLLGDALGGPVEGTTAERLWRASQGNAMFLRELVDDLVESDRLRTERGVWRWAGELRPGARLSELVEARLGRLRPAQRLAVELLAVGEPLEALMLAKMVGADVVEVVERRALVVVERSGRRDEAWLGHPLYGEVLRGSLSSPRVSYLCGMLAEAAEPFDQRVDDRMRLALWRLEAGQSVASGLLSEAAARACALLDYRLAERLADAAVAAGAGFGPALVLGQALVSQGRYAEAERALATASQAALDDSSLARAAYWHALALQSGRGDVDGAVAVLASARRRTSQRRWQEFLQAHEATMLAQAGRQEEATALVSDLIERPDTDEVARLRALGAIGRHWAWSGHSERALAAAEALIEPAMRVSPLLPRAPSWVFFVTLASLLVAGRLDEADDLIERLTASVGFQSRDEMAPYLQLISAKVALMRGRPVTASTLIREAVAVLDSRDVAGWRQWALALLSEASALVGDADTSREAGNEANAAANPAVRFYAGDIGRALAWLPAAQGELSRARALALEAAASCHAEGEYALELHALHDGLRLGERSPAVVERIEQLRTVVDGNWPPVFADHAMALCAGDAAALEGVGSTFEKIGALRFAAEAFDEAAEAHRGAGLSARAASAATRAAMLQSSCEGTCVPPIGSAKAGLAALTRREQEIARLAATGLSSRQIADRLAVSTRTVEGHLYRLYTKLGVSDRASLARLIGQAGTGA
jgi:ATP/maltotriose-dependent transcriptional regulator MalT